MTTFVSRMEFGVCSISASTGAIGIIFEMFRVTLPPTWISLGFGKIG
jgi:hypothetical protein